MKTIFARRHIGLVEIAPESEMIRKNESRKFSETQKAVFWTVGSLVAAYVVMCALSYHFRGPYPVMVFDWWWAFSK